MPTPVEAKKQHSEAVQSLIKLAERGMRAVLYYRKGATRETIRPRVVEPYTFNVGKQDLLIKCWQLQHGDNAEESGWRFFMAHKIDAVEPTSIKYHPRIKVTLPAAEVESVFIYDPAWDHEGRRAYRDYVGDALADGVIDAGERFDIEGIKQKFSLTMDDIRFVHASIYHRCIGAVLDDGFVKDEEVEQIRFLHKMLWQLGWCVGD